MSDDNLNIMNEPVGFYYKVTEQQIKEHRKRSVREILEWIENTNELVYKLQTEEERRRSDILKRKYKQ